MPDSLNCFIEIGKSSWRYDYRIVYGIQEDRACQAVFFKEVAECEEKMYFPARPRPADAGIRLCLAQRLNMYWPTAEAPSSVLPYYESLRAIVYSYYPRLRFGKSYS